MSLSHKDYYKIAIPFIISTVTQPLLGAVDTAVIGQRGVADLIAGVAVGTVIMNTLYWLFGFFRISTTGQSAIALGQQDEAQIAATLIRPFILAGAVGTLFIILQSFIWQGATAIIAPEAGVTLSAKTYFDILIWGAPIVLLNYVVIGWLMGQAKVKATLFTQVFGNVINIILDAVFVLVLDWGVAGVAAASLIAQACTLLLGLFFIKRSAGFSFMLYLAFARMTRAELKVIVSANTDLLLRTICLLTFFNMIARTGSQLGAEVLAANAIMMQVTFMVSYLFDGVANASSVFAGKAVGQKNAELLNQVIAKNFQWTTLFVVICSLMVMVFKDGIIVLFTQLPDLTALYHESSVWLLIFPLAAGYGLTIYGIFTGTGTTAPIRNSTFMTLLVFLTTLWMSVPVWGNQGLWLAFTVFYVGRFVFLYPFMKQVRVRCC